MYRVEVNGPKNAPIRRTMEEEPLCRQWNAKQNVMLLTQVNFKSVIRRVGITVFDDHLHIPLVSFTRWILLAFR